MSRLSCHKALLFLRTDGSAWLAARNSTGGTEAPLPSESSYEVVKCMAFPQELRITFYELTCPAARGNPPSICPEYRIDNRSLPNPQGHRLVGMAACKDHYRCADLALPNLAITRNLEGPQFSLLSGEFGLDHSHENCVRAGVLIDHGPTMLAEGSATRRWL